MELWCGGNSVVFTMPDKTHALWIGVLTQLHLLSRYMRKGGSNVFKNLHVLAHNLQQGNQTHSHHKSMTDLSHVFFGTFQSCGCVWGTTCAVFLSLIKHLCQNIELVLTEHRALSQAELVLTATSSHQIYTCIHSETHLSWLLGAGPTVLWSLLHQ